MITTVTVTCCTCGKTFERPLKRYNQFIRVGSKRVFCSKACFVPPPKRPLTERFWEKVEVRGPDDCWNWKASTNDSGYGHIIVDGKVRLAPRVAWELANGPIPPGEGYHGTCVLHHCDNPACVNVAHLFLGSNADNARDKAEKGRVVCNPRRGVESHWAKLTEDQVREVRAHPEISCHKFAKILGVTAMVISKIRTGKTWKHLV